MIKEKQKAPAGRQIISLFLSPIQGLSVDGIFSGGLRRPAIILSPLRGFFKNSESRKRRRR
jgi:hypothetical protein